MVHTRPNTIIMDMVYMTWLIFQNCTIECIQTEIELFPINEFYLVYFPFTQVFNSTLSKGCPTHGPHYLIHSAATTDYSVDNTTLPLPPNMTLTLNRSMDSSLPTSVCPNNVLHIDQGNAIEMISLTESQLHGLESVPTPVSWIPVPLLTSTAPAEIICISQTETEKLNSDSVLIESTLHAQ